MSKIIVSVVQPTVSAPPGFQYIPLAWIGDSDDVAGARNVITAAASRKDLKRGMLLAATEDDEWGRCVGMGRVVTASKKGAVIAVVGDRYILRSDGKDGKPPDVGFDHLKPFMSVGHQWYSWHRWIRNLGRDPQSEWGIAKNMMSAEYMIMLAHIVGVRRASITAALATAALDILSTSITRGHDVALVVELAIRLANDAVTWSRRPLSASAVERRDIDHLTRSLNALTHTSKMSVAGIVAAAATMTIRDVTPELVHNTITWDGVLVSGVETWRQKINSAIADCIPVSELILAVACANQLHTGA